MGLLVFALGVRDGAVRPPVHERERDEGIEEERGDVELWDYLVQLAVTVFGLGAALREYYLGAPPTVVPADLLLCDLRARHALLDRQTAAAAGNAASLLRPDLAPA